MDQINIPIQTNLGDNVPLDLGAYVSQAVGLGLLLAALAAFAYLVLGGIQWIMAGGDKGKIEQARDRITNAIIGVVIVSLSWAIFLLLDYFFGLGIAGKKTPTSITLPSNNTSNNRSPDKNPADNNSSNGISFNCLTTSQCDVYCPNSEYYTARNEGIKCGVDTVGCACLNKSNSKVIEDVCSQKNITCR